MKIREHHKRDFAFYLKFARNWRSFDPTGPVFNQVVPSSKPAMGLLTALECFVEYESKGIVSGSCRQPRLLQEVLRGKRLVNFQIKQWAEDYGCFVGWAGLMAMADEYRQKRIDVPEWVWRAVRSQGLKMELEKQRRQGGSWAEPFAEYVRQHPDPPVLTMEV